MDSFLPARVALLSLHSSPYAPLGGVDAGGMNLYVRRLAADLSRAGIAVDVFTRRTDPQTPAISEVDGGPRLVQLQAGPARWLPRSALPMHLAELVAQFRSFVRQEDIQYDILHSHYWLSGFAAVRYRSTSGDGVPLVHMFHTLSRVKEYYLGSKDGNDAALRFDGERCVLSRADVIVGATSGEADDIQRFYGKLPPRYEVIPPGVDLDLFYPRRREEARNLLGLQSKRVILFVGRADPLKGLDTLLHSVVALPAVLREGLAVVIVGAEAPKGSGDGRRLRRQIARLGLKDVICLAGKVDHLYLPMYYSAADVLALPSAYESFGMAAAEAMACGTPVVGFEVGGLAALVQSGRTGFLAAPGEGQAYARLLAEALTSPDIRTVGRRARASIQEYTWEATADKTLRLYAELMEERSDLQRVVSAAR